MAPGLRRSFHNILHTGPRSQFLLQGCRLAGHLRPGALPSKLPGTWREYGVLGLSSHALLPCSSSHMVVARNHLACGLLLCNKRLDEEEL